MSYTAKLRKFSYICGVMTKSPVLYLIPVNLSDAPLDRVLPAFNTEIVRSLRYFIVENIRTARRFLKRCDRTIDINTITFAELNIHTDPASVPAMLAPMSEGHDIGVMSEAGCPAIADPGALVVAEAQRRGYHVVPLVGPSSILMGLMGSGFNGQGFSFHGYLPITANERDRRIKELESAARRTGMAQIFIETPYRNNRLLDSLASLLQPDTLLCVASAITDPEHESIITLPARKWKSAPRCYDKIPTIFLISRP